LRGSTALSRIAALVALGVAIVAIVLLLSRGGDEYEITAEFENASQLVPGNEVVVGGVRAGSVKSIELGPNGQAEVTLSVDEDYAPLERGTTATVRSYSLSGIANRQIQLTLPADGQGGEEIADGGSLSQSETVSEVDLDEVFNTLDPKTVSDFKHVIQGFEISYDGVGEQANRGFRYLNPFLSTSRGLFSELAYDRRALQNLIVDTSQLSGTLASRAPEVSALVGNLNQMMGAIGSEKEALAEALSKLPGFMREANTTFVNLRAALDDVDPLITASKPAARELQPFMAALRGAGADAVPTIADLDQIIQRPGQDNDLVEITRDQVGLNKRAVGSGAPECGSDPSADFAAAQDDDFSQGAFGESACALRNSNPTLAQLRAYSPELVGWFDDFSHVAHADAEGIVSRIGVSFNQFTPSLPGIPDLGLPVSPSDLLGSGIVQTNLDQRCPGTNDRPLPEGLGGEAVGGVPFTDSGTVVCDPDDTLRQP
jgi:phospholipid/cholesterol/gamma-HCH transport system substrate-binding protein